MQMHHHRSAHWVGRARHGQGNERRPRERVGLRRATQWHRLNPGKTPLEIIEVKLAAIWVRTISQLGRRA
jgi:hypothetical protein